MKKTLRTIVTLALMLTFLLGIFPMRYASAENICMDAVEQTKNNPYQKTVAAIDAKKPAAQRQLDHYDNKTGKKISGNCNISSIITLINRRLAYDNRNVTFRVADAMKAYKCTNYTQSGNKLYYPNNNCSDGWASTTYKIDGYSYQAKSIKKKTVEDAIKAYGSYSFENFCQYIALLLHEHPEGIAARFYYSGKSGGHVFVFTKYELVGNKIQLYVYDPVNDSGNMKLENSYMYKNAGKGNIHKNLHFLCYLKGSEPISFLSANTVASFEKQSCSIVPYVGTRNTSYTSSNTAAATVDSSGKVTMKKTGAAEITVCVGGKSEKVKVVVFEPARIKSLSNVAYHSVNVSWERCVCGSGYEIQYSTSSSFSDAKSVKVKDSSASQKKIGSLSFGKTYYFRIRSYVVYNGTTVYSDWSKAESKKIVL